MRFFSCFLSSLGVTFALAATNLNARANTAPYELKNGPLDTPWTQKVGTNPWPEYPRPLLERKDWKNLNGVWQYQNTNADGINQPPFGVDLPQSVLVPFCLESALSGVMESNRLYSWYRTHFDVPREWPAGNRVLLNFGAVDYEATVFVNGKKVTTHTGGYWSFTVDITDQLSKDGPNELLVFVDDPTDKDMVQIPIGKQTLSPSHIFYTPCSGIWQTVWIESAPSTYISNLQITADMHGKVEVKVEASDESKLPIEVTLHEPRIGKPTERRDDKSEPIAKGTGSTLTFNVDSPKLWSPDSPNLYDMEIKYGNDTIKSYIGFRTISRGVVEGVERPLLNGEFVFQFGTLDQGFWPDGIYTAPSVEAMTYDLETLKKIGYNMVRKHIKVEPALFYRACDELGLLVIQDMPSLRTQVIDPNTRPDCPGWTPVADPKTTQEFGRQLELMIQQLRSYPSIVTWVIYNEEWGQPRVNPPAEFEMVDRIRKHDTTRLINSVSGWHDHGAGDFHDNHHYANPQCGTPFYSRVATPYDPKRIAIQGEFAGIGHNASFENSWKVERSLREVDQTYELNASIEIWNYRAHILLSELLGQVERFACSAAVWTQTTDVEGEVNGMLTYDRRVLRPDLKVWNEDIRNLYRAAARRGGRKVEG
ncbi:putative hydrolase [Westerdykella ornata]|uniref:Putative hydrolase n=1 Tax=Westerdykella ornata TaxID=318751 RepID=A0A6A6JR88_WESOR|nr:putative hydrolase [Westerdykella ornata]KAF2278897.1 putative hydrolase [Westerdykella ornata]